VVVKEWETEGRKRRGYALAAEPVADVVCIPVVERHPNTRIEQHFQVFDEVRVDEVAG